MSGKGKRSKKASAAPTEHESVENAGPVSATLDLEPVALDDSMNPWASPSPTSASAPTVPSETADEAVAKKASKKKKKALAATVEQFEQIPAGVPETILLPELLPKPVPEVEHHDIAPKPEVVPKKKAKKSKSSSALPTTAYGASVEIVSESAAVADVQSESISVVAVEVQDVQQVPAEEAKPGKKKSSKKLSKTIAMVEPTLEEQTSTPINLVAEQPTIVAVSVETPLVEDAASLSSSKKKSSKKVKNYNSDILAECRPGLEVAVEPVVDIAPEEVVGADEPVVVKQKSKKSLQPVVPEEVAAVSQPDEAPVAEVEQTSVDQNIEPAVEDKKLKKKSKKKAASTEAELEILAPITIPDLKPTVTIVEEGMEKKKTKKKAASVTPVPDAVLDATSASEPAPMHVKEKKKIKKTVSAGLEAVAAQSTESPASEAVAEKKALKKKSKSKEETPKIIAQDVVSTSAKESSDPELAADTVAKPATATASAVSIVTGVVTAPVTAAISAGNAVTGSVTNLFGSLSQAFAAFLDPELPPEEVAAAKRKLQEEVMKRQQENNAKFAAISQMIGLDATAVAATNAFSGDAPTASSKKKGLVANGVVDEDNIPLAQLQQNPASSLDKKKKKKVVLMEDSSDADSDSSGGVIVVKRVRKSKKKKSKRAGKQQVASDSDDSDSDSDSDSESESDSDRPAESPSALSRFGAAASGMASAAGFTKAASPKKGSKKSSKSASGILGKVTATFTSILEPDMTPEEKAAEKKRKAQNEALERQMANQRHFAKENKIEGLNVVDASKISLQTTTLMSSHTFKSARSEKCMPIADIPVSEEEFTRGLNYYNQRDYQWAITHWERAIKIDNNAESLRMLIELHGPSKVPNAAKVAEYTQRRRDFLQTPQGMLNHGRHLARMAGTLDGSGIVLVRSAADLGHAEACYEFGMYLRGKGKGAEAMGWLHQAADGGFIDAEEAVAEGYEKGLGGAAKDAVAGAAWRARVVARLKAKEVEELAMLAAKAEQAKELQQDAIRREKERAKLEQGIKVREENLLVRRNMDSALNGAIRNLEWGFYAAGVESLHKLAQTGNVDAHDYLDPDLSVIPAKQIVAMYHIGQYHSSQANPEGAVKWFRRSAESGYHEAQVTYAAYLIVGKGLDCADPGQAMAWLMKAWENGRNKEAALALGEAYTKGIGVAPDPTKAVKWYTRAWDVGGYSEAAFAVGLANATGFTPGAVDPGAWSASGKVGGRQNVNEVLNKRSDDKHKLDEQEATPPTSSTQSPSDSPSKTGKAVPPKPNKVDLIGADAATATAETASVSSASSSPALRVPQLAPPPPTNTVNSPLLKNFSAFKQDVVQAAMWYKKASDLGHSRACNNLGELYMTGRGVQRNDVTGFALFRRAAMAGLPEAEYNMGRCCREGRGCTKNEEQAVMWFRRAEAQGIKEATKALNGGR